MAKELPYFKFITSEWMKGDITICSYQAQGLFINICTYYWMKDCSISLTFVQQKFKSCLTELDELINNGVISISDDTNIVIDFLDEQYSEFDEIREKRSQAGKKSASTRVQQVFNKSSTILDKDKDKDNIKRPTIKEFENFFIENGYLEESARTAYHFYNDNNWIDSKGKEVKNWKNKIRNIWFKPENKNPYEILTPKRR